MRARSYHHHIIPLLLVVLLASCSAKAPVSWNLRLQTAAPQVLVVSFTDGFHPEDLPADPRATNRGQWSINGREPLQVYHAARPVDELPKTKEGDYPLETRYWTYLVLDEPLVQDTTYAITGPFGESSFVFDDASVLCESIKVNQVGYDPDSPVRYANLGVFMGDGGSLAFPTPPIYQVINVVDGETVYEGVAAYLGDDTRVEDGLVGSGEHVYRLDLRLVPPGGPYRLQVAGFGISHPFEISDSAIARIAYTYTRGLYHQRCGIALEQPYTEFVRDSCHTEVAFTRVEWSASGKIHVDPRTPLMPISGGYHDAGDFDRRPYHTIIPLLMLAYYEAFPTHFSDGQYNLPESGNGLPDFLDEALWGLQVWEQLQIQNPKDRQYGAIMAGTETSGHPEYGMVNATSDTLVYGTWAVYPETTAYGAGMMAQAARLLLAFPAHRERAQALYDKALLAWDALDQLRDPDGKPYLQAQTADMLYASLQIALVEAAFQLAGTSRSRQAQALFGQLSQALVVDDGHWPHQYRPGNITAKIQTAHFSSYLVQDDPFDTVLAAKLRAVVFAQAARGGYMGFNPEQVLYPQGVQKTYGWGAATAQGRYADVYAFAYRLETDVTERNRYLGILSQFGDYALGLNPLGQSYVTGLGTVQPQSPLHLDSWFTKSNLGLGNVPGLLIYGPSEDRSGADYQRVVSDAVYPLWEELPLQRRWADGWSLVNNNEFTVWETMVWNICLYGVLNGPGA